MTTDFRQIVSEALVKRMGLSGSNLSSIFHSFSYNPSGSSVFVPG